VHVEPFHWLHEIFIFKIECCHFQHGLTTPIINWGDIFGNLMGTHWELGKNEKKPSSSKLKRK
jgi:hypothetical protein